MNEDLKKIKKYYGESMMQLCRELFPTVLETEGLLFRLLTSSFLPCRELYGNIINNDQKKNFQLLILSQLKQEQSDVEATQTPYELMNLAGYDLYQCNSENEIQQFKKYYAPGEELCTFNGNRLSSAYVFFAVKKDVQNIKRENFKNPSRQDEYGTSVISIQFTKGKQNTVSIKNRYNHTVTNPDATFSNNLDNIIKNLRSSFSKYFNLNISKISSNFELPNYHRAIDQRYYKYNFELDEIYFCSNNIIVTPREVKQFDTKKFLLFDNYLIDFEKEKVINLLSKNGKDSFTESLGEIVNIKSIILPKNQKKIIVTNKNNKETILIIDNDNNLVKYQNDHIKVIEDFFLGHNRKLEEIIIPNCQEIGGEFLKKNIMLNKIYAPNLKRVQDEFLGENKELAIVNLPNLEEIGSGFLMLNEKIKIINLPKVRIIDSYFLTNNQALTCLYLPKVKEINHAFLSENETLQYFKAPLLEKIGEMFLKINNSLIEMYIPNIKFISSNMLQFNKVLNKFIAPFKIESSNGGVLPNNKNIKIRILTRGIRKRYDYINGKKVVY